MEYSDLESQIETYYSKEVIFSQTNIVHTISTVSTLSYDHQEHWMYINVAMITFNGLEGAKWLFL